MHIARLFDNSYYHSMIMSRFDVLSSYHQMAWFFYGLIKFHDQVGNNIKVRGNVDQLI
jgi:hypothetical protein